MGYLGCGIPPFYSLVESIIFTDRAWVLTGLLPCFSETQALETYGNYPNGPAGEKRKPRATPGHIRHPHL